MSRHGYCDEVENFWDVIRWSGALKSALRGRRGQAFLRELLAALDALPEERLIAEELEKPETGEVCALGAVGRARGLDMRRFNSPDIDDWTALARAFGIPETLAREVMFVNDELEPPRACDDGSGVAEERFRRVRAWVLKNIRSRGALVVRSPS